MQQSQSIPLNILPLPVQRYSCHGCGNCCRDFTVQLREEDLEKLRAQSWERLLGDVTVEFRGRKFLAQRPDGACVFLLDDGKCRIHAEFGLEAKPLACQLFPFNFAPDAAAARVGISFACASVLANQGASLPSHMPEVRRMANAVTELTPVRTLLDEATEATPEELQCVANALDGWIADGKLPLTVRIDGLAWLGQQLSGARFSKVRGARLKELMETLISALPQELPLHPVDPATRAQQATLRQAAFFRLEDPKIGELRRVGRVRAILGQYMRSRAFAKGVGRMPAMGDRWPSADFAAIDQVQSLLGSIEWPACEELLVRWMRATILGGRAWGSGYYGWSVPAGIQALALNVACACWLARAHAAASGRREALLEDVRAAIGRVDRSCGRAPWIGSRAESMRMGFLRVDDGLRRVAAYALVNSD
jgi:lysine-N-methylase